MKIISIHFRRGCMEQIEEGTLLWEPDENWKQQSNLYHYMKWLKKYKNLNFQDYHSLWKWSVDELEVCWSSLWEYFEIQSDQPYQTVLTSHNMPGTKWFPEATINYTEHIFRKREDKKPSLIPASENRETTASTWKQRYQETAALQHTMEKIGVPKGDRVVAYAANTYETIVAFLATASLGAIWSSASPDFG